jgi:ubiquitin-conjugating enzyme E2 Q
VTQQACPVFVCNDPKNRCCHGYPVTGLTARRVHVATSTAQPIAGTLSRLCPTLRRYYFCANDHSPSFSVAVIVIVLYISFSYPSIPITMDMCNNTLKSTTTNSNSTTMSSSSVCFSGGAAVIDPTSGLPSAAAVAAALEDDAVIAAPPAGGASGGASAFASPLAALIPMQVEEEEMKPNVPLEEPGNNPTTHNPSRNAPPATQRAESDSDESEYEYEDDDDAAFSGFLLASEHSCKVVANTAVAAPAFVEEDSPTAAASSTTVQKPKWREPSRAAVNMSLRAQKETTGSKRRLAQDLYRIMNQDHDQAGFSLAPQDADSMDAWKIKLFQFDADSNLQKDMDVLNISAIELEMKFPDQYPFEPPFVRVVKPRFKRQTGFVMNGALCMELLTRDGWNPINDIESVIVSIRSLLVVGDGRLQAAVDLSESKYKALLNVAQPQVAAAASAKDETGATAKNEEKDKEASRKRPRRQDDDSSCDDNDNVTASKANKIKGKPNARPKAGDIQPVPQSQVGAYSAAEAQAAYSHLSDYHKKKGWDTSGWWARKG